MTNTDMPPNVTAQVTPEMLRWAREQAGCGLDQAAKSAGAKATTVAEWENAAGDVAAKVKSVADVFGVSRQAVAVRTQSYVPQLISEEQYRSILGYLADEYREFRESRPIRSNGWPHWRAVRSGDAADPWVIAYALALGGVVVSEEQRNGREVKIPDV